MANRFDPQRLNGATITRLESYSKPYAIGTTASFATQLSRAEIFQALDQQHIQTSASVCISSTYRGHILSTVFPTEKKMTILGLHAQRTKRVVTVSPVSSSVKIMKA